MTYVVQASPLTKIFLPQWQEVCLKDPEKILANVPFDVVIPRPCGSITLTHGVPVVASELIKRSKERKIEEDETAPLVAWLTDERNAETDIYGIVAVPIEGNVAEAIMTLVSSGSNEGQVKDLMAKVKKEMAASIVSARERADARVMRQCHKMYSVVRETVRAMKADNKGVYSPSYSEALAMDILRDQIKVSRAPDDKAQSIFQGAMNDLQPEAGVGV